MKVITIIFATSLLALASCASVKDRDLPPERVYSQSETTSEVVADGSIFSKMGQEGLLGIDKARRPGDLITILIDEQVSASTSANGNTSRTSKTTALTANALAGIGKGFANVGLPWPSDISPSSSVITSTGVGTADEQGKIAGAVTGVVTEVLPNGLLAVRAYKRMELSRGAQVVRVQGLVRPSDIQPDNTIRSRRLADAEISFAAKGELADASHSGWMNRALLKIWPF